MASWTRIEFLLGPDYETWIANAYDPIGEVVHCYREKASAKFDKPSLAFIVRAYKVLDQLD